MYRRCVLKQRFVIHRSSRPCCKMGLPLCQCGQVKRTVSLCGLVGHIAKAIVGNGMGMCWYMRAPPADVYWLPLSCGRCQETLRDVPKRCASLLHGSPRDADSLVESKENFIKRMSEAKKEISHYNEYDFVIVNEEIKHAVEQIKLILFSERLRKHRQNSLKKTLEKLL